MTTQQNIVWRKKNDSDPDSSSDNVYNHAAVQMVS